jgi:acyl carrier protein phosphodiesterase
MNFLAHIYLSGNDTELRLGNFLGDFVVGDLSHPRNGYLPMGVREGVVLHRKIDSFTDTHPIVRQGTRRLQPKYHKFSGILVDVFYDHYLAKNFAKYSQTPLDIFAKEFYAQLKGIQPILPREMDKMIDSLTSRDWLGNYAHLEGIDWTLRAISRRTVIHSGMENALQDLQEDYEIFEKEFTEFFEELIAFCQQEASKL